MSEKKIRAKDLSYEAPLPPFLQALRAQVGGTDRPTVSGPKRAVKKRSGSEEAEDTPLVVDEEGNVVSVEVDKEGAVKETAQTDIVVQEEGTETKKADESSRATFGGRKRKVGKVVGDVAEGEADKVPSKSRDDAGRAVKKDEDELKLDKKPKKKAKKIKLSFDEEDG